MKVAVCAGGKGLDAPVDQRFGRCAYFVLVDAEQLTHLESVPNDNTAAAGGAGPQSARILADRQVEAVLLGNVGPNAAAALQAAGISIYSGVEGTVRDSVMLFKEGELKPVHDATVSSHFGTGGTGRS